MTIATDRIRDLVEPIVAGHGLDLEDVVVTSTAGRRDVVLTVDRDAGLTLDLLGELTREISGELDEHPDLGDEAYTLEITSPGVGRPLTLPRHWRRARGRKVRIDATAEGGLRRLTGRVGQLSDDAGRVEIVVNTKGRIGVESLDLAQITRAAVDVDFSRPSVAELSRCGLAADEIARRRDTGTTDL
ncbi:MAG: ribosome maturation factor RimP [Gordonia sp. (in: high G+C Gram-positive bacteria)]